MQTMGRILDVRVFVLAGAAFCCQQTAAVNLLEIPIGEFIVSLGVLRLFVVDSQIPLAIFGEPVAADEFIFLLRGRLVLAPCIALVVDKCSFADELFGVLICAWVKGYGHGCSPLRVATYSRSVYRRAGLAEDGSP